jgi:hypothetical protein
VSAPGRLSHAVREVLVRAESVYRDEPATARWLRYQRDRLDEPLRVAIAGKVKAGKSTLLNALVGEQIAPTDAGECTRVVTWYRDGPSPRIVKIPKHGPPAPLPVDRRDGALVIDLQGMTAQELDHLVVDWPSQSLRTMTLVDTPGIESLSTDTGQRTWAFLDPDDDTPTEADAVIYLMRHVHATDARFLEAFRDQGVARAASVNAVAVISRADEIAGGRVDAMFSARAIASRYRGEPALRGLCQNVVAVAGLLAQTSRTLRHAEFAALRQLAEAPSADLELALISADRFLTVATSTVAAVSPEERRGLLRRFGVFGIRLATALIRQGARDTAELAKQLVARSGLQELQHVLHTQFTERRDLLKARSALLALESVLHRSPCVAAAAVARDVERILTGAHEFSELRMLSALRSGAVVLPADLAEEAERLLGDHGAAAPTRLGLPRGADDAEVRGAALKALAQWQTHAEDPMLDRAAADACRVVVRTCEGLLAGARVSAGERWSG